MSEQPTALRLADALDGRLLPLREYCLLDQEAAAELRRLHQSEREGWRYTKELEADAQVAAHAKRLALELECLLLSCEDKAAVSRWWDSAHEALANYRTDLNRLYPPPPTFMGEPVLSKGVT